MMGLPLYERRVSLRALAAEQSTRVRGVADNSEGRVAILFAYENETYENWFTTGYFDSLREAVEYSRLTFLNEEIEMNIFKNDKLFPNIRGVMLKEKRITLTMSGRVNVVEMVEGNDARAEIFFTNHEKTAVINGNQLLIIADVYGPESDNWKNRPVVLYGEKGKWFGKWQWGVRVDKDATEKASKTAKAAPNGSKPEPAKKGKKGAAPSPPQTVDDIPFDEIDPEEEALAELIFSERETAEMQADLFPD